MLQGIAWDYDGTIGRTFDRQFKWFKHWASLHKKHFTFKTAGEFLPFYNTHIEKEGGVQNVYDALRLPCDISDRNHPVWPAYIKFLKNTRVEFYPGLQNAILDIWSAGGLNSNPLANRRVRMAINTTNSWDSVSRDLEANGVLHCFDCFVTDEVLRAYHGKSSSCIAKPSGISLALTLGLIDSPGEYTAHIGDTTNDLVASQKVVRLNPAHPETLVTIGVAWGYEPRSKLEQGVRLADGGTVHFNYIVDNPRELAGVVKKLIKRD